MDDLLTGPLHDRHTALGATLGAFGGWSMPISYPDGTVADSTAVRTDVGVFDVSHLGKLAITGPGAAEFVNRCFTANLNKIDRGQAQYTLCCNATGGVLDDIIVYVVGPDEVLAVPNAANAAHVAELLRVAPAPSGIDVVDRHRELAVLAVQGPRSPELVPRRPRLHGVRRPRRHPHLPHRLHRRARLRAARAVGGGGRGVGRAGGVRRTAVRARRPRHVAHRDGLPPARSGPHAGDHAGAGGQRLGGRLGQAGVLGSRRAGRREGGRACATPARAAGHRTGDTAAGHDRLVEGGRVGVTTSGTFSPTLKTGIALALLDPQLGPGAEVDVDVRGRPVPCVVTKPPFVPSHVR